MSSQLTGRIDPFRLAKGHETLQGQLDLDRMRRLAPVLQADGDVANVSLEFDTDAAGTPTLKGHVKAQLKLQCQRCMQPMDYTLDTAFLLGLVGTEVESKRLPPEYDPYVVETQTICIADIVEDEILLALPIVALHQPDECAVQADYRTAGAGDEEALEQPNPFAALEDLKGSPATGK